MLMSECFLLADFEGIFFGLKLLRFGFLKETLFSHWENKPCRWVARDLEGQHCEYPALVKQKDNKLAEDSNGTFMWVVARNKLAQRVFRDMFPKLGDDEFPHRGRAEVGRSWPGGWVTPLCMRLVSLLVQGQITGIKTTLKGTKTK